MWRLVFNFGPLVAVECAGPVGFEPTTFRLSVGPSGNVPFGAPLPDLGPGTPPRGRPGALVRPVAETTYTEVARSSTDNDLD